MTITENIMDGTKVLRFSGKFDFQSRHEFHTATEKTGQGGVRHLILNFQEVTFMDSAGLGLLANMHKDLTSQLIRVSIVNPQNYVKRVLELAKMDQYFSICDTEEQAMTSMAKV